MGWFEWKKIGDFDEFDRLWSNESCDRMLMNHGRMSLIQILDWYVLDMLHDMVSCGSIWFEMAESGFGWRSWLGKDWLNGGFTRHDIFCSIKGIWADFCSVENSLLVDDSRIFDDPIDQRWFWMGESTGYNWNDWEITGLNAIEVHGMTGIDGFHAGWAMGTMNPLAISSLRVFDHPSAPNCKVN